MKKILALISFLTAFSTSIGQVNTEKIRDSLMAEGQKLYRSEMASWYGTDLFFEKYKNRENIGGYLSYIDNDISKCIFFSKNATPKVIGTISFDTMYNVNTAKVDLAERDFTKNENELFILRSSAFKVINSDTSFKVYRNTNLNLIPLVSNGQKKVYILTGPEVTGVVIFGNDYLLTFDNNNELISKRQLHKNIISVNYGENKKEGNDVFGTMHTHLPETGDFITATDICTLMLYEKFAKWQQHIVISENFYSIWDCNHNNLAILTKQAWDNINNDQKKRNK